MNIIITGASNGIGFATAELFCAYPEHKVICISRNPFKSEKNKGNVTSVLFDFESGNIEKDLLPQISKQFDRVDVLINNAGTLINKSFQDLENSDWKKVFQINLFSLVELTRCLVPLMEAMGKKKSHIVNISSLGGFQGSEKFIGLAAYSASKAALVNLTECLALELAEKNIAVNCLCLGAVQTEMLKLAFPEYEAKVKPADMAKYLFSFCLNAQEVMNGKIIPVSLSTS